MYSGRGRSLSELPLLQEFGLHLCEERLREALKLRSAKPDLLADAELQYRLLGDGFDELLVCLELSYALSCRSIALLGAL